MRQSGLYRLFIKNKSYINSSKNIDKQIKKDIKIIKNYLYNKQSSSNEDNFKWLLNFKTLPKINENNYKMALYIVENDLSIKDINFETLKLKDYENELDILEDEMYYINKFNSDINGFNNILHLNDKLMKVIQNPTKYLNENSINLEELMQKKENKNIKIQKLLQDILNNNQIYSPWLYYNLKDYEFELKHHPKWLNYCDSILSKYEKWKKIPNKV